MTDAFDDWWNEDDLTTSGNNFVDGTPAYWAWEGWCAGVKAEREACAGICDSFYLSWIEIQGRYEFMGEGASECAGAIRARGQA